LAKQGLHFTGFNFPLISTVLGTAKYMENYSMSLILHLVNFLFVLTILIKTASTLQVVISIFDVYFQVSCYYYLISLLNLLHALLFYLNFNLISMMVTQRKNTFPQKRNSTYCAKKIWCD
jgi:hypothetical protein